MVIQQILTDVCHSFGFWWSVNRTRSMRFPKLGDETVPFLGYPAETSASNDLAKQWLVEPPMPGVVREKVICWKEYIYQEDKEICASLDWKRKVSVKQSPEVYGPKTDELAAQVESLSLGDAVQDVK